jgi:hypothetical protein
MPEVTPEELARQRKIIEGRLKDERVLIFTNLMNGVPDWQVARDFHKSLPDVMQIKSRRLERMEPPIIGNSISEIQRQRITVMTILPKLNLDKDPLYRNVLHEPVEIKNDGSIRNEDFLYALKPLPGYKPVIG